MTILIIEDETRAARRLEKMVKEIYPDAKIPDPLESVEMSINYLKTSPEPDVILMDIELADGKSFEILNFHDIHCPIIFCTAFDQYAVEAFKHEGVAYLLKPIKPNELEEALKKAFRKEVNIDYDKLAEALDRRDNQQKRLLVKLGHRYKTIDLKEVAYAFTEDRNVMVMTRDGKETPVDQTLEQLEEIFNPSQFFRINRKIIVNIDAIDHMYAWSRSRLRLELEPARELEAVVATDRAADFKKWLEGK